MIHKQTFRWIVGFICIALILITMLAISAKADDVWTPRQDQAHQIAELARQMDLPETDPIITRASEIWTQEATPQYTDNDAALIAKTMYIECGGVQSETEKACVVWTILNRVDAGYGSIEQVITAKNQFVGYKPNNPVRDDLLGLAYDVLTRWQNEHEGQVNVGRVLPSDYCWFTGDGRHNHFTNAAGTRWSYSLASPYTT